MLARPKERDRGNLPYHDRIIYNENREFVVPPVDIYLLDTLVVLLLMTDFTGRQRGSR